MQACGAQGVSYQQPQDSSSSSRTRLVTQPTLVTSSAVCPSLFLIRQLGLGGCPVQRGVPNSVVDQYTALSYLLLLSLFPFRQTADIQVDASGCWPSSVQCSLTKPDYSIPCYFITYWTIQLHIPLPWLTTPTPLTSAHHTIQHSKITTAQPYNTLALPYPYTLTYNQKPYESKYNTGTYDIYL